MELRKYLTFGVTLFAIIQSTFGFRKFWKGRRSGGNLGGASRLNGTKAKSIILPPDEWFEQMLDHFNPTNVRTWKQRFYTNKDYYEPGGPVFLLIGGEGEATAEWMVQGAWIQYAKEHNALCFQLEHRFYGQSHPTEDLSTENLVYLSSQQALADLAYFIISIKEKFNLKHGTKLISFGGSYPGSLAAWLRQKYPYLVHGSISSSGPLLAKADFKEYNEVVKASLATYSDECVTTVQKSIQQVEILLKDSVGMKCVNKKFKLCDPVENSIGNDLDISNLFETLAGNIAGVVQYNNDLSKSANINDVCKIMVDTKIGTPVDRLAEVNRVLLKQSKDECLDYRYDKMLNEMRNISWTSNVSEGMRQWTYQTCTEFGFYQTSDHKNLLFGDRLPVEFFIRQCEDIYGKKFDDKFLAKAIFRSNANHGALDPETTNVIYVHGSIDPWHALGLTESVNSRMPAIYIKGTSHCANMYEPQENDLPQLKAARVEINKFIKSLIET